MSRDHRFRFARVSAALLPVFGLLSPYACRAAGDDCGHPSEPSSYHRMPGDVVNSVRLEATRTFRGVGGLEINVCRGELRIERSPSATELRVVLSSPGADRTLDGYLQDFEVSGGKAKVNVRVPEKYHPVVTVLVPSSAALVTEVNLGSGTLLFHADGVGGGRELNVGAGTAHVYLDGDTSYSSLEANVGFGRFEDHREHGHSSVGVVAKESNGSGSGKLEINVGAGELFLEPAGKGAE